MSNPSSAIFLSLFHERMDLSARLTRDPRMREDKGDLCVSIADSLHFYITAEQAYGFADVLIAVANDAMAARDCGVSE